MGGWLEKGGVGFKMARVGWKGWGHIKKGGVGFKMAGWH